MNEREVRTKCEGGCGKSFTTVQLQPAPGIKLKAKVTCSECKARIEAEAAGGAGTRVRTIK
jgi:hypothetical protein